jgi:fimbrial isopeptide formation D2 family protein
MPGGIPAFIAFTLSMFMLLAGALVVVPVEPAEADDAAITGTVGAGVADGYFNTLSDGTLPAAEGGWASVRRIMFGKQGNSGTYGNAMVSAGYKTLAKGEVHSEYGRSFSSTVVPSSGIGASSTTSVHAYETLLWADDAVTAAIAFDTNSPYRNSFDSGTNTYKSNLAVVSDAVAATNYSAFERGLVRVAKIEGVCTAAQSAGCNSGNEPVTNPSGSFSVNSYAVFPLSIGDVNKYLGHTDGYGVDDDLRCKANIDAGKTGNCANGVVGTWLRTSEWNYKIRAWYVRAAGAPYANDTGDTTQFGLRPALRLSLERLLLSADSSKQGQSASADLRLTFVESGKKMNTLSASVYGNGGSRMLNLSGDSDLSSQSGLGWKIVDPESNAVLGSGKTNDDGNMALPEEAMTDESKDYDLYVWGQQDGNAAAGLTNKATEPVKATIRGWKVKTPPSYGIELTGTTVGTLTAYRIGDYQDEVFDQTGALKSVVLTTPAALKDALKDAAEIAGGSNVDADNPIGWVASHWLGYPTDPLSDDVTSAFSPYAGQLQLFAKELAKDTGGLGAAAGSLSSLAGSPETLKVSGPGLYLIVDSSQGSGGSLPIIVGTKVFNDALGEDGSYVDFVDAGVKGKPRLGQAALKTTVTDIAKRIVNDAGLDGFDVGSSVEFEVALRVPDLSSFTSVAYDSYKFNLTDVVAAGLTLPADGSGVEVFVDALSPTEPQNDQLLPGLIAVSGDTLSVDGLKAVFAESDGVSGVKNKNTVPAGSLMRLRYTAVLNASAVVSSPVEGESLKPNVNAVTLTRSRIGEVSNGWTDAGAGLESKAATANAYTFKLDVVKLDKDDLSTRLGGVEFEVSRAEQEGGSETLEFVGSDGVYRLAVAGETGSATVVTKSGTGDDAGTLSLLGVEARELSVKETKAPSGYFRVSDFGVDIRPVWNEDATQITKVTYATSGTNLAYVSQDGRQVTVLDPAWSLANLPYTGGIGILVLLVFGGLMLVFAVRPYVLSERAERDANLV